MSKWSEPTSERIHKGIPFLLRTCLWLYLVLHGYLHFQEFLSPYAAILFGLGGVLLGWGMYRLSLPLPWAFLGGIASPFLLYFTVRALLEGLAATNLGMLDSLLLGWDQSFHFMIIPLELLFLFTLLYFRIPAFATLESALRGLALGALFFTEGFFRFNLYTHPLPEALSILIFLTGEILFLALTASAGASQSKKSQFKGTIFRLKLFRTSSALACILFALYLGYEWYLSQSTGARGGLLKAELFRFDFTPYLTLETEIRQSKDLVLLYKRSEPLDRYLLKRYLLEGYTPEKGFFIDPQSPEKTYIKNLPAAAQNYPIREQKGRRFVEQEIYLVNLDSDALISLDYPIRILPLKSRLSPAFSRVYRVDALALDIFALELSEAENHGMDAKTLAYYTKSSPDPRIQSLAEEITLGLESYYEKVQAISDFLKYDYYYSERPGKASDGDRLGHFLFSSKKGYCSYFAFAMALLCRSIGIPARVVLGFYIDPKEEFLGFYPVYSDMAHAWVEVYFQQFGWVDFDPTSQTLFPGETLSPSRTIQKETLASLLKDILSHPPEWEKPSNLGTEARTGHLRVPLSQILSSVGSLSLYGVPLGLLIALMVLRFRYSLKGFVSSKEREKIRYYFLSLLQDLGALGLKVPPNVSTEQSLCAFLYQPPRFFKRIAPQVEHLFFLYQKARFAPSFSAQDAHDFFTLLQEIRTFLIQENGWRYRLKRIFHPSTYPRPL
ncbi:MAG: transglutaminase domain-containing protein [Spirochaetales bacterium]